MDSEDLLACVSELRRHEAVEEKVDAAVDESHHVHDLAQRIVAGDEELFT